MCVPLLTPPVGGALLQSCDSLLNPCPCRVLNARSMTCQEWVVVESISAILLESAVEVVLILRSASNIILRHSNICAHANLHSPCHTSVHAMYAPTHPNILRALLVPTFLAQLIIMVSSLAVALPRVMSAPGCIATVFPKEIVVYTIASIVYEAFLFVLTVHKYRTARKEGWGSRTLLAVLVRDGIWAFALVLRACSKLSCLVLMYSLASQSP